MRSHPEGGPGAVHNLYNIPLLGTLRFAQPAASRISLRIRNPASVIQYHEVAIYHPTNLAFSHLTGNSIETLCW
jgi:hypothetical protein